MAVFFFLKLVKKMRHTIAITWVSVGLEEGTGEQHLLVVGIHAAHGITL